MKRLFIYTSIFMSLFLINAYALPNEHALIVDELNTLNIKEKLSSSNISSIKKICTYDFCQYIDINNINRSIEEYTNKYLENISDEEIINAIKVKGIKITKIIMNE